MNKILSGIILFALFVISCQDSSDLKKVISGEAQGTTYNITFYSKDGVLNKTEIDSLLYDFDLSLSTYNPYSIVSAINNNDTTIIVDEYFKTVFEKSMEVSSFSDGLFDVTIAPVVNAWGFGFTEKTKVDSATINRLLNNVGFNKVKLVNGQIFKENKDIMLDFNAIAQGYSVDVVSDFMLSKGINDFLVEIGGETRASGKKPKGKPWKVGIDKPLESSTDRKLNAVVNLDNKSLATSGNYRKFYEENGNKYSHTIDPRKGFPARNNLLSATVIANDCMTADAFATLFMVMGKEKSLEFLEKHKELQLQVYFIYDDKGQMKSYFSPEVLESLEEFN